MNVMNRLLRPGLAFALVAACCANGGVAQSIDQYVEAAVQRHGLELTAPADRATWLRRVALDLIGVPPTPAEVDAFVADGSADSRARVVDRLLDSPRFGERWAVWWLDLARYADSQGYEKDNLRPTMWRYRDWVTDALQRDMPFDQFTIEQLAGDLLPNATVEQRLATAFHRNTMTNTEGGTDDEEFRVAAVIDRVDTTMSVWMAATVGCAQCHDHKYDPISQREFYGVYAFFNQTADSDKGNDAPLLAVPTVEQRARQKALELELTSLRAQLDVDEAVVATWARSLRDALRAFNDAEVVASDWHFLGPLAGDSFRAAHNREFAPERDGVRLDETQDGAQWQPKPDYVDGKVHSWSGDNSAFYLHRTLRAAAATTAVLSLGSDDAIKVWCNGTAVLAKEVGRGAAPDQEILTVDLRPGDNELLLKITNGGGPGGFYFDLRATPLGAADEALLLSEAKGFTAATMSRLRTLYVARSTALAAVRNEIASLEAEFDAAAGPAVPVLSELPADQRRTTRLLLRGSHLAPDAVVAPHTPAVWPPMPEDAPPNRLGFARWLVAPGNPRTARVIANRIWSELFGRGLVETLEDFGRQGAECTHPELLDWLGDEFVRGGWSIKRLLRTMVLSAAYGRSSTMTPAARERDPFNVWLARGPAFRLPGETLRDQALALAGLLNDKRGGPSVMPPQPEGVWMQPYSNAKWRVATGADRHRRSLYTFWRRTSPHPAMMLMDAQSREYCVLRRARTNTPLQALVLWNDPQFHEAAAALAALAVAAADDDLARVRWLWRRCLLRLPTPTEAARLLALLRDERRAGVDGDAAWTLLASVVMNLDEFVTRR